MLNLQTRTHKARLFISSILMISFTALTSCMEVPSGQRIQQSSSTDGDSTSAYPDPAYPKAGIFLQESGTQTDSQLILPMSFSDSFLIRGLPISQYLKSAPTTSNVCLVGKFNYKTGNDKFLILSGKPKSYTDLVNKTKEFYLQVEPSNDQANQNDCLNSALNSIIFMGATSPTPHFSLKQVCAECTVTATSQGLRLYLSTGEAIPALNLSSLKLTISGGNTTTGNTCSENSLCTSRGFSCCLDSQCVTDGAVRPDVLNLPGFSSAKIDVSSNPERFVLYPQYYFVCASKPGEEGGNTDEPTNPGYDASIRILEMSQLYNCLNKVDGEFSHCTVKFPSASNDIKSGTPFSSGRFSFFEDINFQNLNDNYTTEYYTNNIVKLIYAGQTLYEAHKKPLDPTDGTFSSAGNDDITTAQAVKLTAALPVNALDDNLYLTFKVDGTCEKLGTNMVRCSKTYIHGSTTLFSPSYHDSTKIYKLPHYADTKAEAIISVKISGLVVSEGTATWTRAQGPSRIVFSASYPLYQNQKIEITYHVTTDYANLTKARASAQTAVNSLCLCTGTGGCNLKPITDSNNAVVNYECVHPIAPPTIPANQTVLVSNKNIPHRYFDINGLAYDEDFSGANPQEGVEFSYLNNSMVTPSNVDLFTGFNEIYGSFTKASPASAKPAKLVRVKKETTYDLYANSGIFSSCPTCGADYYSSVKKIFPSVSSSIGGGYSPDIFNSSRQGTSGVYRSDDLLFGRACFVPATMLPWTHAASSDVRSQRRNRLASQHILFANGYNKDWFGFDYGSLIGSFDGITWFSIGNQRRIKATSNKLFLAVNAYFGDLNVDSNFNVQVSETTTYSSALPDHDSETTGAECQKSHFCSTDNDCFRQVGFDYTCQNVSGMTTNWPQTDAQGTEILGSVSKSLISIVGGVNGQAKRCVYRGRGAPCHPNLLSTGLTFNNATQPGLLACSPNNMCQPLNSGVSRFNEKIARFANTPEAQNSHYSTNHDIVGLGAKIIGRPYDYYGTKPAPYTSITGLAANRLTSICIPGKNISGSSTTYSLNSTPTSSQIDSSDKILGIGVTMSGPRSPKYLNACPATDSAGVSIQHFNLTLGDANTINVFTTTQNLSTNLLDLAPIVAQDVFSSRVGSQVTTPGYQRDACLRAPGASCFSDMDCAPSEFIASRVKTASLTTVLNEAEKKYWEEELICGNPDFKYSAPGILNTADFNIKNNVCCRDFGKAFSVYTQTESSQYHWCDADPAGPFIKVAGINTNIDSINRYSRVHTGYEKMTCRPEDVGPAKSFALSLKSGNDPAKRYTQILTQFKTLDLVNERTCCTKNWVRQFDESNGGGHRWSADKLQTIDKSKFRALNWGPNNNADATNPIPYECNVDSYTNASCEMRDFTQADTNLYLKFFGALELVGIPQVALMSEDFVTKVNNDIDGEAATPGLPPDDTVKPMGAVPADFTDSTMKSLHSGANYSALQPALKKVFSESEFNCCIPSGQVVPSTTSSDQCCTGNLANTGLTTSLRCCLQDYTDLTVYLSRYVSSEGRGLPDSAYDPNTGYIKDPGAVENLANQKSLCCSGKFARGVAIRKLPIPLAGGAWVREDDAYTKRFTYLSSSVDNNSEFGPIGSLFDAGVRWNDHVYCIPDNLTIPEEK